MAFVQLYKSSCGCLDCGRKRNLTFDHVESQKSFNIGTMIRYGNIPLSDLITEIEKCEVRCQHCHNLRHSQER